ncbi:MAG: AraC family transcriptional regulator ligand-binding domain-containing protein [Myxococcota bacterium]
MTAEGEEPAVASSVVAAMIRAATHRLPQTDLLSVLGSTPDDLETYGPHVSASAVIRLWKRMGEALPEVPLGLAVERASTGGFGAAGYLARNVGTGREALNAVVEFTRTISTHVVFEMATSARGDVRIRYGHLPHIERLAHPVDLGLAQLVSLSVGGGDGVRSLSLKHRPFGNVDAYRARFGEDIQFEREENEVWFSAEALDRRRAKADPELADYLRQQLHRHLKRIDGPPPPKMRFSEQLTQAIRRAAEQRDYRVYTVACELGISERQLQRLARRYDLKPREMVEESRRRAAQEALQDTSLSVEAVAQELDYSDARSFTRAFKRWTGLTPAGWRKARFE